MKHSTVLKIEHCPGNPDYNQVIEISDFDESFALTIYTEVTKHYKHRDKVVKVEFASLLFHKDDLPVMIGALKTLQTQAK